MGNQFRALYPRPQSSFNAQIGRLNPASLCESEHWVRDFKVKLLEAQLHILPSVQDVLPGEKREPAAAVSGPMAQVSFRVQGLGHGVQGV